MVERREEVKRPGLRSEGIVGSHWGGEGGGKRKVASGVLFLFFLEGKNWKRQG